MPPTVDEAAFADAFEAAYDALLPHVRHAQVRAAIAERVAAVLRDYHPYAAVTVLWDSWPAGATRVNKAALADVVQAAYAPIELARWATIERTQP